LLREKASSFLLDDYYRTPGGIQFEGPGSDAKPITLTIENQDYMGDIEILKECLSKVDICLEFQMKTSIINNQISNMDMPTNDVFPGEDHGEAWVLPGDPQGGNQFHVIGDRRADGDVPSPQRRAASVPFQVSVGASLPVSVFVVK
jgi:hypothetical protein